MIRIRDLTDFSWDQMYVFKYLATEKEVKRTLGTALPQYGEFMRKIVFMNHGKIVLYEEYDSNVEHPVDNEVVFDIADTDFERSYGPNAAFQVSVVELEDVHYFELRTALQ